MKRLVSVLAGISLALCLAVVVSGSAAAEDELVTITGEVMVEERDAAGDVIVIIVTETDTYLVHHESKAADIKGHAGKSVSAKGKLEVTDLSRTISVEEYALIEDDRPPVGAK
jgi:hypothetical protein